MTANIIKLSPTPFPSGAEIHPERRRLGAGKKTRIGPGLWLTITAAGRSRAAKITATVERPGKPDITGAINFGFLSDLTAAGYFAGLRTIEYNPAGDPVFFLVELYSIDIPMTKPRRL